MADPKKEALKTIFECLKKKLTPEDIKWLKRYKRKIWYGIWHYIVSGSQAPSMEEQWGSAYFLIERIQDMLDAMTRREPWYDSGDELSKERILEIAKILNLDVKKEIPKQKIVNIILAKIQEGRS